ncbi:MarR family winged helix-turn-helix transcriptional regulator [Homoserinibacter sp. YIM 151385]|uniref:MarR family winged helix-turn-helix transcriptional regulator n=1 Tax=Homoserinibacter sp. YIM 151385 TaxID=2985506 RepID=UPI0022F06AF1|nr:MarR family winged helix-turn-helix transcriptional regulator [Homoserinibacter sp. YIM 151385]WBU37016.1 MarR family winged helix-turn-helix transcriptional regulator [Homoserinibacter sp. YIM 151385]
MPQNLVRREALHLNAAPPASPEGAAAVRELLHLLDAQRSMAKEVLRRLDLSSNETQALRFLAQARREQRTVTAKELCTMLNVTTATVTHVVDRLEALGDVERVINPADRRERVITATPAGVDKITAAYARYHQHCADVFGELAPAEAALLAETFAELAARIEGTATRP